MPRPETRAERFSARVLAAYATTGLQETFAMRAADGVTEILLYDEIGYWGVTAKDFIQTLAKAGDGPINLRINSPGGDAFDGMAIYNALRARTAPVTVTIDGLAASAASFIALAGTEICMAETSMMMIHNCWGLCIGDRNDMLATAATQEKIDGQMAAIYAAKTGKSPKECAALMDAETWLTAAECKAEGMCDTITTPVTPPAAARAAMKPSARAPRIAAQLPPYDPDGDGDNDAEAAVALCQSAIGTLSDAIEALTGTAPADDPDVGDAMAARHRRLRLAEAEAA